MTIWSPAGVIREKRGPFACVIIHADSVAAAETPAAIAVKNQEQFCCVEQLAIVNNTRN